MLRTFPLAVAVAFAFLPALRAEDKPPTIDAALKRLKDGNARFAADKSINQDVTSKRRIELAEGQKPFAVVLTCADSRAAPEFIFDQGLGDIFTLRVAGNVQGDKIIASMEFAVAELKTPLIVVLGHSKCGAVKAAVSGKEAPSPALKHLIDQIHIGADLPKDKDEALALAIRNNVLFQAKALTKESEILRDFVKAGRVRIAAGVYSLKSGEVEWLEIK